MIRAVLVATLFGMLLGGGEIAFLTYPVMRQQAAEISSIASDVHDIREYSNINADMVLDGAKRADAMAQARANLIQPRKDAGKEKAKRVR